MHGIATLNTKGSKNLKNFLFEEKVIMTECFDEFK